MAEHALSASAMEKLLKKAGAPRVGEDAKEELAKALEDYALNIGQKAVRLSAHAKRRTVKAADISEAVKQ